MIDGEHIQRDDTADKPDVKKKGMVSWLGYNTTDGDQMRSSDPPLAQAAALGEDSLMAFLDDIDEKQKAKPRGVSTNDDDCRWVGCVCGVWGGVQVFSKRVRTPPLSPY